MGAQAGWLDVADHPQSGVVVSVKAAVPPDAATTLDDGERAYEHAAPDWVTVSVFVNPAPRSTITVPVCGLASGLAVSEMLTAPLFRPPPTSQGRSDSAS